MHGASIHDKQESFYQQNRSSSASALAIKVTIRRGLVIDRLIYVLYAFHQGPLCTRSSNMVWQNALTLAYSRFAVSRSSSLPL